MAGGIGRRLRVVEQVVSGDAVLDTVLRIRSRPGRLGEDALRPVGRPRVVHRGRVRGAAAPAAIGIGIGVVIRDHALLGRTRPVSHPGELLRVRRPARRSRELDNATESSSVRVHYPDVGVVTPVRLNAGDRAFECDLTTVRREHRVEHRRRMLDREQLRAGAPPPHRRRHVVDSGHEQARVRRERDASQWHAASAQ